MRNVAPQIYGDGSKLVLVYMLSLPVHITEMKWDRSER